MCVLSHFSCVDTGIEPISLKSPASAGRFFTTTATMEAHQNNHLQVPSTETKKGKLWAFSGLSIWGSDFSEFLGRRGRLV